jgi:hypothetical protein
MSKRMRYVYNGGEQDMIAHLWMNKRQESARNSGGNFYFNGDTIYSYGSHFPIARHVEKEAGDTAVLMTYRGYSNTTSKHIWMVERAIHGKKIYVYRPDDYHHLETYAKEQMDMFAGYIEECVKKAARARVSWRIDDWEGKIHRAITNALDYMDFFGHEPSEKLREAIELAESPDRKEKVKQVLKERSAKEKAKEEREAQDRAVKLRRFTQQIHGALSRIDESVQHWRETGEYRIWNCETNEWVITRSPHSAMTGHNAFPKGDLLRVDTVDGKRRVRTSRAVVAGYRCAREAFQMLEEKWKSGDFRTYRNEGENMKPLEVCGYGMRSMDEEKVIVGCHTLYRKEIENFAKSEGWI